MAKDTTKLPEKPQEEVQAQPTEAEAELKKQLEAEAAKREKAEAELKKQLEAEAAKREKAEAELKKMQDEQDEIKRQQQKALDEAIKERPTKSNFKPSGVNII